jgi:sugar O-acyltransferase (sialic acid O-acetyltransferase NeuD family)
MNRIEKEGAEKVVIFGASSFAEVIYFCLTYDSPYVVVAFTVDRKYITKEDLFGLPIIAFEDIDAAYPPSECKMIVSVSFQKVNKVREEKYFQAKGKGYDLISYISSKASTWPGQKFGDNCIVLEWSAVGPLAQMGNDVIVASACVGHHAVIGDHSFLAPGALVLGGVTVESNCLIGAHSTIRENIRIGRECIIGSGVSINKNTVEKGVYVERPAELCQKRSDELREWLAWPADPHKPRWGCGPSSIGVK